jgi:LysM repeat protein
MKIPRPLSLLFLTVFFCLSLCAQPITPQQYVAQYKDLAMREMRRMGVPAAIKLAQGLLETEAGNSPLLKKSNNHFGIKCKSNWSGNGVSHDDDAPGECFRVYNGAEDSYRDHSNFLRGSERYAFLFELDPTDYRGWAYGLKKAGYATNPRYPEILIRNIEQYNLQQYSLAAAADVPHFDTNAFDDDPVNASGGGVPSVAGSTPSGFFTPSRINGLNAVLAPKGTSLLAIATANNIPLLKLMGYNEFDKDGLLETEQHIYLEPKARVGRVKTCTAVSGQTLHLLSQQYGIQLAAILQYNEGLGSAPLPGGTRVWLQPKETSTVSVAEPGPATGDHIVQPKEGLFSISRKYGVSVQQLRDWNRLESDTLKVGQPLIVHPL